MPEVKLRSNEKQFKTLRIMFPFTCTLPIAMFTQKLAMPIIAAVYTHGSVSSQNTHRSGQSWTMLTFTR